MLLVGLDLETGGEFGGTHDKNFPVEISLVGYDTEINSIVYIFNKIIDNNVDISSDSTEVHGINKGMCTKYGTKVSDSLLYEILDLVDKADAIVSHNGLTYDKPILESWIGKYGFKLPEKVWIDSHHHVEYPSQVKYTNLTYLAGYYGIVNPFKHRALFDVLTMLNIVTRFDVHHLYQVASEKLVLIKAVVSFEDKQKAKDLKFSWEHLDTHFQSKSWIKLVRESDLKKSSPFPIEVIYYVS